MNSLLPSADPEIWAKGGAGMDLGRDHAPPQWGPGGCAQKFF